jgi:hypothetical protein
MKWKKTSAVVLLLALLIGGLNITGAAIAEISQVDRGPILSLEMRDGQVAVCFMGERRPLKPEWIAAGYLKIWRGLRLRRSQE